MTITGFTHGTSADVPVQRFEVFTGIGHRRDWSDEEKGRIVAEGYSGEISGSAVARRHGLAKAALQIRLTAIAYNMKRALNVLAMAA